MQRSIGDGELRSRAPAVVAADLRAHLQDGLVSSRGRVRRSAARAQRAVRAGSRVALHATAGCLTAGVGNIAAARGIELTEVTSTVEGDIDLNGILGLNDQVRNGFQ